MKRIIRPVVVAIDLDDTVCNTQLEVIKRLNRYLFDKGMLDVIEEVRVLAEEEKRSTMLYPDHLRKIISEEIIGKHEYISSVKLTNFGKALSNFMYKAYWKLGRANVHFVVSTHRPDEYNSRNRTKAWISKNKLIFDHIHFVNSVENSNKIDFLTKEYPNCKIILVDDNPFGDLKVVHPHNPSVLVYNELCDYEAYKHQDKFSDLENLLERIECLAHGTEYKAEVA
jgi:hypothetical protein